LISNNLKNKTKIQNIAAILKVLYEFSGLRKTLDPPTEAELPLKKANEKFPWDFFFGGRKSFTSNG
jgi:hypothetical protein